MENVKITHKDKCSWSRRSIWYVLQCNSRVEDRLCLHGKNYHSQIYVEECKYTDAENPQCSMLSNDDDYDDDAFFLRYKKNAKIYFWNLPKVYKLIINEQGVFVRRSKRVEHTPSKLYENKGRA